MSKNSKVLEYVAQHGLENKSLSQTMMIWKLPGLQAKLYWKWGAWQWSVSCKRQLIPRLKKMHFPQKQMHSSVCGAGEGIIKKSCFYQVLSCSPWNYSFLAPFPFLSCVFRTVGFNWQFCYLFLAGKKQIILLVIIYVIIMSGEHCECHRWTDRPGNKTHESQFDPPRVKRIRTWDEVAPGRSLLRCQSKGTPWKMKQLKRQWCL